MVVSDIAGLATAAGTLALAAATSWSTFTARRDATQRQQNDKRRREDDDAQQYVIVTLSEQAVVGSTPYRVAVTAPSVYVVKQPQVMIAGSDLSLVNTGWTLKPGITEAGQVTWASPVEISPQTPDPKAIARWTDRDGNRYYSYRTITRRFDPGTEWSNALTELDRQWRTGPGPGLLQNG